MNARTIALYFILGLLSLNFVLGGLMAALLLDPFRTNLTVMHYAPAFMVFLGLIEALCGIGIWMPRFRNLALLTLLLIMAGAIGSHIANGQPIASIGIAAAVSALILMAAWLSNGSALGHFLMGNRV